MSYEDKIFEDEMKLEDARAVLRSGMTDDTAKQAAELTLEASKVGWSRPGLWAAIPPGEEDLPMDKVQVMLDGVSDEKAVGMFGHLAKYYWPDSEGDEEVAKVLVPRPKDLPADSQEKEELVLAMNILGDMDSNHLDVEARTPMWTGAASLVALNGDDPEWSWKFEIQKRQILETNFDNPWDAAKGRLGKRDRADWKADEENENASFDLSEFMPDTTYDKETKQYFLLRYQQIDDDKEAEPQAGDGCELVTLTIMVHGVFRGDMVEVERFPYTKKEAAEERCRFLTERTGELHFLQPVKTPTVCRVGRKLTVRETLINSKRRPRLVINPNLKPVYKTRIIDTVSVWVLDKKPKKHKTRRVAVLKPFHTSVRLDRMWGRFSSWRMLDENLQEVYGSILGLLPQLGNRKMRGASLSIIKEAVDACDERILIRGEGLLPWGSHLVKLAFKVPEGWKEKLPELAYLEFEVVGPNYLVEEIRKELIKRTEGQRQKDNEEDRLLSEELRFRREALRSLRYNLRGISKGKLSNLQKDLMLQDLMSVLAEEPAWKVREQKKKAKEEKQVKPAMGRIIYGADWALPTDGLGMLTDPKAVVLCEVCGMPIQKERLEAMVEAGILLSNPEQQLTKRCVRTFWHQGKRKVKFCDGTDVSHLGVTSKN